MVPIRTLQLKIFLIVVSYWVVSIGLVFMNKYVLSSLDIDTPIFISWIQCLVTVLMLFLSKHIMARFDSPLEVYHSSFKSHVELINLSTIFIGMILFNNFTLKMVPVSFYNIPRALTTIFNLIFTRVILKRGISVRAVFCCLVVVVGFLFGLADLEKDAISFVPIFIGVISSVFVSLFSIYTQSSLDFVDKNPWMLQAYTNINAVFLMVPLLPFTGEISIIINQISMFFTPSVFFSILISGVMGFLIGIITNMQIKFTSALTHNISGTAKACVQTILAVIIHREWHHSVSWWIGSFMVLIGSAFYSYVRNKEMVQHMQRIPEK